jgi:hypothetical protein
MKQEPHDFSRGSCQDKKNTWSRKGEFALFILNLTQNAYWFIIYIALALSFWSMAALGLELLGLDFYEIISQI